MSFSANSTNLIDPLPHSSTPESNPLVSVILPTYNAAAYIGKAIESILAQSYGNFELIIINDGSSDNTAALLTQYSDPRILIINQLNLGLPKALNAGIQVAKGKYLARQDADDVSLSERLARQVAFMEKNPSCALLGSWTNIMAAKGNGLDDLSSEPSGRKHQHPTANGALQVLLLINNQFVHSSVMIRATCLKAIGLYSEDPEHFPPEDYDLWLRIAQQYSIANLPQVLLEYLEVPTSISRTKEKLIEERARKMSLRAIQAIFGAAKLNSSSIDIDTLVDAANGRPTQLTLTQYIRLQSLIRAIGHQTTLRFPQEKALIAKATSFLRKQTLKALIKSYLLRNSVRHP
jgi:glycosyltransferase involved in cell wall biosynthesis